MLRHVAGPDCRPKGRTVQAVPCCHRCLELQQLQLVGAQSVAGATSRGNRSSPTIHPSVHEEQVCGAACSRRLTKERHEQRDQVSFTIGIMLHHANARAHTVHKKELHTAIPPCIHFFFSHAD